MKISNLLITIPLIFTIAMSCGSSKPDYSEFYKPDPSNPEQPTDPDDSGNAGLKDNQMKVMSFNVRYITDKDQGSTSWDNRKVAVPAMFADQKPTILGVQEAVLEQKLYMDENCTGYKSIGVGRTDGKNSGEFMAIFYRTAVIDVVRWGTFWLSETPDKPSKGWDATTYRCATWAIMKHKPSNRKFFYINTHVDVGSTVAPVESMKLIEAKMTELNTESLPVLLTADFNKKIDSEIFDGIKKFMSNVRLESPITDSKASYNAFGASNQIVDHIFCTDFKPLKFQTVDTRYQRVPYISDHYPIAGTVEFKE